MCLLCAQIFCLYTPLSSQIVLHSHLSEHQPVQGLDPCRHCINIIDSNTNACHTARTIQAESKAFIIPRIWLEVWDPHRFIIPICSCIKYLLLSNPQYLLRNLHIPASLLTCIDTDILIAAEACHFVSEIKTKSVSILHRKQACTLRWEMQVPFPWTSTPQSADGCKHQLQVIGVGFMQSD